MYCKYCFPSVIVNKIIKPFKKKKYVSVCAMYFSCKCCLEDISSCSYSEIRDEIKLMPVKKKKKIKRTRLEWLPRNLSSNSNYWDSDCIALVQFELSNVVTLMRMKPK